MSELIKIQRDETKPMIICPKCKAQIFIDLTPFTNDVSKILRDNCYKCGGELHVGVLILSNPTLNGLLQAIQVVSTALAKAGKLFMGGIKS